MKNKNFTKIAIASTLTTLLCACNGFFDKDNTPTPNALVNFKAEATPHLRWETSVNSGVGNDYLKMVPAINEQSIFTTDKNGMVVATNKTTGNNLWKQSTGNSLSTGPAIDNGLVFVGSHDGKVIALRQTDGKIVWNVQVASEILAAPAASAGIVLVKTIDGQLTALSETDGHTLWHYHEIEPTLILRAGSAPQIENDSVVAGFANGNLVKLNLQSGSLQWQETVAVPAGTFAIQRMIDIDADPYIFHNKIFVATYQGRISALELASARSLWTHDISSFNGLSVDNERVYASDAMSHLWAFSANNGNVAWEQKQLESRNITGPANMGNAIVVGDAEGYIHWLSKQDGHLIARVQLGGSGILVAPIVNNNVLYVLTKDGHLAAYTVT